MFTVSHDYYGILGVSKNATPEEIKRQYRKLMREYHPDQFNGLRARYQDKGDEDLLRVIDEKIREAEEKCKLINEAFGVLSDPVKREQYDGQAIEPSVPLPEISIYPTRIAFGSLLEGLKKSLEFTIENKGGPPATVNIDWEGNKPDWGELVIEPDAEKVFPIKVTVKVDTTNVPSGPKYEKILVDVDGRIHLVEVFLAVTSPVVAPAPSTGTSPVTTPSPALPTTSLTVPAILGAILVLGVIVIGGIVNSTNQQSKARSQQQRVWATQTAAEAQATLMVYPRATEAAQDLLAQLKDASRIAFQTWRGVIFFVDADGSDKHQVARIPKGVFDISSEGTRIVTTGGCILTIHGKKIGCVEYNRLAPDWLNDGRQIVWSFVDSIHTINADLSRETVLFDEDCYRATDPAWSPNGESIAFSIQWGGNDDAKIYVVNADGSDLRQITHTSGSHHTPEWSPDGKRIAFSFRYQGVWSIYTMDVDGSHLRLLAKPEPDAKHPNETRDTEYPAWSSDGRWIVYVYQDDIYVTDVQRGATINVTNTPDVGERFPVWLP